MPPGGGYFNGIFYLLPFGPMNQNLSSVFAYPFSNAVPAHTATDSNVNADDPCYKPFDAISLVDYIKTATRKFRNNIAPLVSTVSHDLSNKVNNIFDFVSVPFHTVGRYATDLFDYAQDLCCANSMGGETNTTSALWQESTELTKLISHYFNRKEINIYLTHFPPGPHVDLIHYYSRMNLKKRYLMSMVITLCGVVPLITLLYSSPPKALQCSRCLRVSSLRRCDGRKGLYMCRGCGRYIPCYDLDTWGRINIGNAAVEEKIQYYISSYIRFDSRMVGIKALLLMSCYLIMQEVMPELIWAFNHRSIFYIKSLFLNVAQNFR